MLTCDNCGHPLPSLDRLEELQLQRRLLDAAHDELTPRAFVDELTEIDIEDEVDLLLLESEIDW